MNFFKKNLPIKKFNFSKKSSGGRNNKGSVTVKSLAFGHKKNYRILDFFRTVRNIPGKVRRLEYDPNRNSYIALVCYKNSMLSYTLAYEGIKINDIFIVSNNILPRVGNSTIISKMPIGMYIYNLEYFPNSGSKIARSGGSFCQILKKYSEDYILIRLRSKEYRLFYKNNYATYGVVINKYKKFEKMYKAGQNIYKGIKPHVRGEAMNPVDHPHGGNTSGGRHPVTFSGKLAKGIKTRLKTKVSNNFIVRRKK